MGRQGMLHDGQSYRMMGRFPREAVEISSVRTFKVSLNKAIKHLLREQFASA